MEGRSFLIITGKILGFSNVFNPCNMLDWLVLLEKVKNRQEYVYICSCNFTPQVHLFLSTPIYCSDMFVSWFTQQENGVVGFSGR